MPTSDIAHILQEMREEYWRALEEAEAESREEMECLLVRLGGQLFAFETVFAAAVLRIPKLVRIPRVPPAIVGVFNLRGEITAAVDVRPLLQVSVLPASPSSRLVVLKGREFRTGLLVEEVAGVFPLDLDSYEPPGEGFAAPFIRGRLLFNDTRVVLLDVEKLLDSPELVAASPAAVS